MDPLGRPPLKPFTTVDEQIEKTQAIFNQVDPVLGGYFHQTISDGNVDIPNRKNKGGGAYCTGYNLIRKPFVFCNSVGTHNDVQTLIHESGHSFHVYETANLPYLPQLNVTMEMAEVASMAMELLATPYLEKSKGGFYTTKEAARAISEHLITSLLFWPYMAVVDAFQHWVYLHPEQAMIPENCDAEWGRQWDRFMQGYDWTGYEDFKNDRLASQDPHPPGAILLCGIRTGTARRSPGVGQRPQGPGQSSGRLQVRALIRARPGRCLNSSRRPTRSWHLMWIH